MAEYYRNYYLENREEINAYNAAWQKSTPERIEKRNRQGKRYRENNPEKVLAAQRSWNERNRDKKVAYVRNRRAREDGAEGFFTGDDWAEIKEKYDHRCIKCFLQEPEIKLTPDHVVPLFLGGTNWPSNIQPLCGKCNSSKGPKFIEFRPERLLNGATVNV
jgi:5-methylcytosine-specific restriction endonuclease McrA